MRELVLLVGEERKSRCCVVVVAVVTVGVIGGVKVGERVSRNILCKSRFVQEGVKVVRSVERGSESVVGRRRVEGGRKSVLRERVVKVADVVGVVRRRVVRRREWNEFFLSKVLFFFFFLLVGVVVKKPLSSPFYVPVSSWSNLLQCLASVV